MINRIVISGAPGSGKTSLINKLRSQGEICHPEISREIISVQLASNGEIIPWKDIVSFTELVIKKRTEQFHKAKNKIEYYDRSIIDSFAYLLKNKLKIKSHWDRLAKNNRYFKKVFIAPPWEDIYKKDKERREDYKTATKIHSFLLKSYVMYEYDIIIIPKTNIQERVQFIKSHFEY